jgi:hypothetical protein
VKARCLDLVDPFGLCGILGYTANGDALYWECDGAGGASGDCFVIENGKKKYVDCNQALAFSPNDDRLFDPDTQENSIEKTYRWREVGNRDWPVQIYVTVTYTNQPGDDKVTIQLLALFQQGRPDLPQAFSDAPHYQFVIDRNGNGKFDDGEVMGSKGEFVTGGATPSATYSITVTGADGELDDFTAKLLLLPSRSPRGSGVEVRCKDLNTGGGFTTGLYGTLDDTHQIAE